MPAAFGGTALKTRTLHATDALVALVSFAVLVVVLGCILGLGIAVVDHVIAVAHADPQIGETWGKTTFNANTTAWLCEDHGRVLNWILDEAWILVFPVIASILGNFRSRIPQSAMPYIDMMAGDVLTGIKHRAQAKAAAPEPATPTQGS